MTCWVALFGYDFNAEIQTYRSVPKRTPLCSEDWVFPFLSSSESGLGFPFLSSSETGL